MKTLKRIVSYLAKGFIDFKFIISKHPIGASAMFLWAAISLIGGFLTRDEHAMWTSIFLWLIAWFILFSRWIRKTIIVVVLTISMAIPANTQESDQTGGSGGAAAWCAAIVAGVVVVTGAVITKRIRKFCKDKQARDAARASNNVEELTFYLPDGEGGDSDVYAADLSWDNMGSCYEGMCDGYLGEGGNGGSASQTRYTAATITIQAQEDNEGQLSIRTSINAYSGADAVESWTSFQQSMMQDYGIKCSAYAGNFSFTHNGLPILPEESPIQYDPSRNVVKIGRGHGSYYLFTTEWSADLKNWSVIDQTEMLPGFALRLINTETTPSGFYRVSARRSD